jgi:PGF-CTERM protein
MPVMRRYLSVMVCVSLLLAGMPAGVAAQSGSGNASAYAGTHVSFDVAESAVTDYRVANESVFSSVKVQSQSGAESGGLLSADASLSAVTSIAGSALSVESRTSASASIRAEGSASMSAHDNGHGVLVVSSGDSDQYVVANLSSGASAEAESEGGVAVTTANGTEGTFIVVGDGNATVNDDGDVSAALDAGSKLAFRAYPGGKDGADERGEEMIANGTATAEVHAMAQGGEAVFDTVTYAGNTTVESTTRAEGSVNATVDRASSTGTVVIASVSEEAVAAASDITVEVDGEAAAEASSDAALRNAIGSNTSKYAVAAGGAAEARTDVFVAVNHFSERTVSVQDGGSESGADGDGGADGADGGSDGESGDSDGDGGDTTASGGTPGFGPLAALAALAALVLLRRRQ